MSTNILSVTTLSDYSVISFDVWDTLLRRVCHPEEVKLRLCRYLWLRGLSPDNDGSKLLPVQLYWKRKEFEDSVATSDWEYKFVVAIDGLLKYLSNFNHQYSTLDATHLEKVELAIETSSTYVDNHGIQVLANARRETSKILFISDFYHSSGWISRLLHAKGILHEQNELYVSSDHLLTKRSGDLFNLVSDQINVEHRHWIHIGDNIDSDVRVPQSKGISTYHYSNDNQIDSQRRLSLAFRDHSKSRFPTLHSRRISQIPPDLWNQAAPCANLDQTDNQFNQNHPLIEAGCVAGRILIGYLLKVLEDSIAQGVDTIHFFSREGVFFSELYKILVDVDVYDMGTAYPSATILRVSRAATFAASIREITTNEFMRLWNLYSHQSINAFARSLNLSIDLVSMICSDHDVDPELTITYPWQNSLFLSVFSDHRFQSHLAERCMEQRAALTSYLDHHLRIQGSKPRIHIVDIGWRGTIQDNLAFLMPESSFHGTYLALERFLNEQPVNCSKTGYLYNKNKEINVRPYIDDFALFEFIFNAPGGSVSGYTQHGTPLFKVVDGEERAILNEGRLVQHGIKKYIEYAGRYVKQHGLISSDLHNLAVSSTELLYNSPPSALADAFNSLHHNETFGTGLSNQILQLGDISNLLKTTSSKRYQFFNEILRQTRWKQSLSRSSHLVEFTKKCDDYQLLSIPTSLFSSLVGTLSGKNALIVMPPPIAGSGGHRTILNLAKGLAKAGCSVEIQLEEFNDDLWYIYQEIENHAISVVKWWQPNTKADIAIATVGYSPEFIATKVKALHKYYFIQDYEASFSPVSDGYVNVQNSYNYNLIPLCIGSWLPHVISVQHGKYGYYSGLGVDHAIYKVTTSPDKSQRPQIAFLYQPEKARRLAWYCLKALEIVKHSIPDVRIVSFGSDKPPPVEFEIQHMGLVNDLNMLNELYNSSSLGLCISLTNPSRIPFEMMAAGCVPVDVYRYNNLFDYPSHTAILAHQDAPSIAEAILIALKSKDDLLQRSKNCQVFASSRSIEWEIDVLVNAIISNVCLGSSSKMPISSPQYTDMPIIFSSPETDGPIAAFCKWQQSLANINPVAG